MAMQLQVRNRASNEWICDGETNRNAPTKFMREVAADYRRERPDYEVRFVREKEDFVK